MKKIDRRKKYYLMIDTETTNTIEEPLTYDIGYAVVDKHGNVYKTGSFIVTDIMFANKEVNLMASAYYMAKLPLYFEKLHNNQIEMKTFEEIRKEIFAVIQRYEIKKAIAHNARFDNNALNTTLRYLTNSRERYFLPYGVEWQCTLTMARQIFGKNKNYRLWCEELPTERITKTNQVKLTAEVLYQYITGSYNFIEEHTGLADALIEKDILAYCLKKGKKGLYKSPFGKAFEDRERAKVGVAVFKPTQFQWLIHRKAKYQN